MVYQAYGGMSNPNTMSGDQNRKIFLGGLNYQYVVDRPLVGKKIFFRVFLVQLMKLYEHFAHVLVKSPIVW